ncbi:hypothetical protein [Achromobacter xylosoxidans]|uniref:Uncharacterized protein n=1 Tax=Alcaligenes xylosoxydans xylosoxydans TaxID=85698 RepID=A0A424W496_ALCXX|nr:hypothetical protein [Achromobacter xylosoxidans]MBC9908635.1 hypothetical protein [Achromobacter xylosoxidans]MBD0872686.1 hypothetical protein [Achromobacter xylosoxidans]QNP87685.1 hypothetical protein IAG39_09305 [Achromobacter xylosoxidans]RPJ88021.1 hypothetical protein DY367_29980 [Achromobacter xylosoxidans]
MLVAVLSGGRGQGMIEADLDCPVEPQDQLKRRQHELKMLGVAYAAGQWGADSEESRNAAIAVPHACGHVVC